MRCFILLAFCCAAVLCGPSPWAPRSFVPVHRMRRNLPIRAAPAPAPAHPAPPAGHDPKHPAAPGAHPVDPKHAQPAVHPAGPAHPIGHPDNAKSAQPGQEGINQDAGAQIIGQPQPGQEMVGINPEDAAKAAESQNIPILPPVEQEGAPAAVPLPIDPEHVRQRRSAYPRPQYGGYNQGSGSGSSSYSSASSNAGGYGNGGYGNSGSMAQAGASAGSNSGSYGNGYGR